MSMSCLGYVSIKYSLLLLKMFTKIMKKSLIKNQPRDLRGYTDFVINTLTNFV